jgi:uncharacterized membrane protein YqjE
MAQRSPFPPTGSVTAAHAASSHPPPVRDSFQRLLDGVQSLFREHLALARLEFRNDVKRLTKDAVFSAAGLPLLLVGYALLMVAVGLLLAQWLPGWAGFGIVAVANLVAGGAMAVLFGRRIGKQDKVSLRRTTDELQRDREWMSSLREGTRPQAVPVPALREERGDGGDRVGPTGHPVPLPGASMPAADGRLPATGPHQTH